MLAIMTTLHWPGTAGDYHIQQDIGKVFFVDDIYRRKVLNLKVLS